MSPPVILLLKADQLALFRQTEIAGHVRNGRMVRPYQARRKHVTERTAPAAPAPMPQGPALVEAALKHLSDTLRVPGAALKNPQAVKDFMRLRLSHLPHEAFHAIWLDNQHRMIEADELARGTIDGASVYPREVVKRALERNAQAVIFSHNHPSGVAEPSVADRTLTERLKAALAQIDIRVLDHVIVGGANDLESTSFAERGWI